ncbi:MAG: carboxy terminal-processing peptidase [Planctomycetaceae bacterium]|nr:carboxy terminal-processing peptidase [Planctomycetaceae bacterium]
MIRCNVSPQRLVNSALLGLALVAGGWVWVSQAETAAHAAKAPSLTAPSPEDRRITIAVASLLRRGHLSGHALDDEMSERCMTSFLKSLDPLKMYFYKSDIDGFMEKKSQLDDLIKKGDISFAYHVFGILLQRVDERVKQIDEILAETPDFSIQEDMIIDPKVAEYPVDAAEARDRWRKRIKYDLLVQKADGKTLEESKERLDRRYHSFAKRLEQTDHNELLEMYLTALTSGFDPHTSYMSPKTLENFEIAMRLQLDGIGAALQSLDGYIVVSKIIPGGAADKDGRLKPEDRIVGVGQNEEGEIVDVLDMKLPDVVDMIRGKQGTVVRLQVIPVGATAPVTYAITRAKIELTDSEARGEIVEQEGRPGGGNYKIGVINLPSFYMDMEGARMRRPDYKSTTRDVKKILDDFNAKGVDAVVMDLRNNGGGSLTEAISLTGLFIDEGPVVQVKGADGEVQHYDDLERGTAWNGPLVVLVNKLSASASEIFAGAVQDYGRGLIIGDAATHGKGSVQTLREVGQEIFDGPNSPQMGALKITMQKFYRPSGDSTQNRGVVSDIELPWLTSHLDIGESDLDYAMEFDRVPATPFRKMNYSDSAMLNQLRDLSKRRIEQSPDFQKVQEKIAKYEQQKRRKTVDLNEEKFLAERKELNAEKEEEKQYEEMQKDHPVVVRDFYFNEALNITADYLRVFRIAQN